MKNTGKVSQCDILRETRLLLMILITKKSFRPVIYSSNQAFFITPLGLSGGAKSSQSLSFWNFPLKLETFRYVLKLFGFFYTKIPVFCNRNDKMCITSLKKHSKLGYFLDIFQFLEKASQSLSFFLEFLA